MFQNVRSQIKICMLFTISPEIIKLKQTFEKTHLIMTRKHVQRYFLFWDLDLNELINPASNEPP